MSNFLIIEGGNGEKWRTRIYARVFRRTHTGQENTESVLRLYFSSPPLWMEINKRAGISSRIVKTVEYGGFPNENRELHSGC